MTHVHVGDCTATVPGGLFHACLCDPPYELGFMGKDWDASGVAFHPETWRRIGEHLHPGAFLMAFASSRGWHRLACAIEDAGFIIHPTIFGWAFGSGFPKATRIDTQVDKGDARDEKWRRKLRFVEWMRATGLKQKQINSIIGASDIGSHYLRRDQPEIATAEYFDKLRPYLPPVPDWVEQYVAQRTIESKQFAEREVVGKGASGLGSGATHAFNQMDKGAEPEAYDVTAPATPLARAWAGHRYGLQSLKPALEPIIVAQKPYSGKPVDCITRTGAGALAIDAGRIGTGERRMCGTCESSGQSSIVLGAREETHTSQGRWPANFILLDEEAAAALDRQSGVRPAGKWNRTDGARPFNNDGKDTGYQEWQKMDDEGGASRYFYNVQAQLDAADPIRYQAKASRRERDAGLEGLDEKHIRTYEGGEIVSADHPGTANGGRATCRNHHPTVKPIDLARYLATLLLPPAEYAPRRILVPFAGVGSEMIGAMLAGWDEVVGIEQDAEYANIARLRIAHWQEQHQRAKQEVLL